MLAPDEFAAWLRLLESPGLGRDSARRLLAAFGSPDAVLSAPPDLLAADSVAIVGSRKPTPQGTDNARRLAHELSDDGLTIVSGLALGIDGAAHDGALLSEYAPGTPALPENFPQRNRIIAGLSLGTLVVEAALRSGSLITARLAAEAGREVFAIPGSIHAPQSQGCHALIKQGAKLVESAADIVEELRGQRPLPARETAAAADPLLDALGHDPVTMDALQARTGMPTPELAARLLDLELDGRVARLPGGLFQRRGHA